MDSRVYEVDELLRLLGCHRHDNAMLDFIGQFDTAPIFTENKEDGADSEHIEFRDFGFCLSLEADKLNSIFLFSSTKDSDYLAYPLRLPSNLSFELSKSEVFDLLGSPSEEGGGYDEFFGNIPHWFRYEENTHFLHIEFTHDLKCIQMVTLMSLDIQ